MPTTDEIALQPAEFEQVLSDISAAMVPQYESQQQLIDRALRKLELDLQSGERQRVIEEVKREIAYRRWCANASI